MAHRVVAIASLVLAGSAFAQQAPSPADHHGLWPPHCERPGSCPHKQPPPPRTIEIKPWEIAGKLRGVQLLVFVERANEELERASLEHKSFIPALVTSVDDGGL
jgi:hypothetical protein